MENKEKQGEALLESGLTLMYLEARPMPGGRSFDEYAPRHLSVEALKQLEQEGLIFLPQGEERVIIREKGRAFVRERLKRLKIQDKPVYDQFQFRCLRRDEVEEAARIESICFPPNEACTLERIRERVEVAQDYFLVAEDTHTGGLAGFLNGVASGEEHLLDEFFTDASTHVPGGETVFLLGLDVLPQYRGRGLARELVYTYARREWDRGTKRLVLTCLEEKVPLYLKLGFTNLGQSTSQWGGDSWIEMDMSLSDPI